ncbi:hypothetical protein KUO17_11600 [Pseudomonas sp. MAFF 301350]|uniref:Lipoprotein n=1 Tax=Pseudomonas aegrilactucae TaxID=2854028 RepID=A0A9Q2XJX3_9PSED|nr:hypothetical protein [Pseudomonas aegrilactucae]MBV6287664.1 hypothetical protein [Pseudomonas aegrilactucae]
MLATCTLALLLAVSGCAGKRPPPPAQPPVVLSQAAWQQVDWEIMGASEGASRSAQDYARRSMRVWKDAVYARTEADFIPWFTGYWTQQWLTLKVAWYKVSKNQQTPPGEDRLALYLQEQYRERVLEPVAKEINPDLIRERATQLYVQLLGQQLQAIAQRYRAAPDQFALHLNRIPAISLGPPAARNASLHQLSAAQPLLTLPAYLALNEQIHKAATAAGEAPSDTGLSSVAKRASVKLEATLVPRGAASAIAAAVGKAVGTLISLAAAGVGAMLHEDERPAMVEQLRVILNVALNEEWQALMQNPTIGVMAGVNYLSEQIEGSLVLNSGLPRAQP